MVDHDTLEDDLLEATPIKRVAFGLAAAFAVVEGTIRLFDLYRRFPWVDVPSHLLSGAAVTALLVLYLNRRGVRRWVGWSLFGNVIVALGWEVAETVDEIVSPDPVHLQDVFVWDGLGDIASALLGGVILLWAISRKKRNGPTAHSLSVDAFQLPGGENGR